MTITVIGIGIVLFIIAVIGNLYNLDMFFLLFCIFYVL